MTDRIPVDFANQRPRHMAYQRTAPIAGDRVGSILRLASIVCLIVACVGLPVGLVLAMRQPDQPVVGAAVGARSVTLTPFQPVTKTQEPTATQPPSYPTFTHTPRPTDRARVYVTEIVIVKEITVTPMPTYTPYPTWTHPAPTPDKAATVTAQIMALEVDQARRSNLWAWALTIGGIGSGIFFIGMFAVSVIRSAWRSWKAVRLASVDDTTETADEIADRVPPPINDWRETRRKARAAEMWARGASQADIERALFGYTGGDAWEKVSQYIREFLDDEATPPPHPPAADDGAM